MEQNRWKSKVLWASIAVELITIGQLLGFWAMIGLDTGTVGNIVASALQILVIFGVLNNPTDPQKF